MRSCITDSKLVLKEYQSASVEYLLDSKHKGVVVAFGVGAGKTVVGVTAASCVLKEHNDWKCIIITPTSLQENFKTSMELYGLSKKDPRFLFFTPATFSNIYDFPALLEQKTLKKGRTDKQHEADLVSMEQHEALMELLRSGKVMLIIDEAHYYKKNLNPLIHFGGEIEGARAEVMIECAKLAGKILLLTATPLYNELVDVVNLVAMARGEDPLTEAQFNNLIGYHKDMHEYDIPKFLEQLKNNQRAINYFSCIFDFKERDPNDPQFPKTRYHNVELTMPDSFYLQYRIEEQKEGKKKKRVNKDGDEEASNAFYNKIRKASVQFSPNINYLFTFW